MQDMDLLKCRWPTVLTRVSEYMDEIRAYVQQIHDNGMAYAVNGSIYFDTQAYRYAATLSTGGFLLMPL